MYTKNQISFTRKIIYGIMLLAVFFSAFGASSVPSVQAQALINNPALPMIKMQTNDCFSIEFAIVGGVGDLPIASEPNCLGSLYTKGSVVTLTAQPGENYIVYGWHGTDDDASIEITNTITIMSNQTIEIRYGNPNATAEWGELGGEAYYPLDDLSGQSIYPNDPRIPVPYTDHNPWNLNAYLELYNEPSQDIHVCTGWFIGPHTVIAAGHCFYNTEYANNNHWVTKVRVVPAKNGTQEPYGSQWATNILPTDGWVNSGNPDIRDMSDYAALTLPNDTLGNTVGWYHYGYFSDSYLIKLSVVNTAGYPVATPDNSISTQWLSTSSLNGTNILLNMLQLVPFKGTHGQSGSAIWYPGVLGPTAISILTQWDTSNWNNYGVRITKDVALTLRGWGAATEPLTDISNADTIPPSGSWTSPGNGQTISSRSVTLSVNASDNSGGSGVKQVDFSAKWGGIWRSLGSDTSAPYSMSWDMCNSGVPNGDIELGMEVWDNANNNWVYSSVYANYHINKSYTCTQGTDTTPPTVSWTSPSNGQTITSQNVTLSANASDNSGGSGVREVRWSAKWNNTWYGIGSDTTAPYSSNWDMCAVNVPNGDVELGMEVWDNANNKWVYSEHYTNYHINKNYACSGTSSGSWETWGWQNHYLAGYENWHGTVTWANYPYIWWDFGSGGPFGWGGNDFSLRMQRDVYFPGGDYSFHVDHDDGARVYLDGQLIIDAWWDGNGGHDAGRNVSQGNHQVKVEFYENQGDALLHVLWYGPGYPRPDSNPPDGRITSPTNQSATASSPLAITADASDDASGVNRVEFYVWYCDSSCSWRLISTDYDSPYSTSWDWSALTDQHIYLTTHVIDNTGKVREDPGGYVEVDLDRTKPSASITSPTDGAILNGNPITITADGNDSLSGIATVQFFIGYSETAVTSQGENHPLPAPANIEVGGNLTAMDDVSAAGYWHEIGWDSNGSDGWSMNWNPASVPDQTGINAFAYAYDKAGNYQSAIRINISLYRPPSNDNINAPIQINSIPYTNQQNTNTATIAVNDPAMTACGRGTGDATVWYKYLAPANGLVHLDTAGSDYDTVLAVWSGAPGSLTPMDCNDDDDISLQSDLYINMVSNTTYYIEVAQYKYDSSSTGGQAQSSKPTIQGESLNALNSVGGTLKLNVTYDTIAPVVISSMRANPDPTNLPSVDFTVTFSEPVTGVSTVAPFDDFVLTTTVPTGAAITGVNGSGRTYTVTVNTGTGNGTLRLDVPATSDITDFASNALTGLPYTSGEIYTIDKTPTTTTITTTYLSSAKQDGWLLESSETSKKGGALNSTLKTFRLGDDAAKKQYRSILSFGTGAGLPDTAVITKVTLRVKKSGITGGGNPITAFQGFMADVKKGFFGTTALQVSDFQTAASKTYGPFKPALSGGWYSINLTSGQAYVNKLATSGGLTQIRLRFKMDDNNNTIANYLSLYSGNASAAYRPQLIIEYYVP